MGHCDAGHGAYSNPPNTSLGLTVPVAYQNARLSEEEAYLASSSANVASAAHHVNLHSAHFANQFAHPSGLSASLGLEDQSLGAHTQVSQEAGTDRRYFSYPQSNPPHCSDYDAFSIGSTVDANVYGHNRDSLQNQKFLTTGVGSTPMGRSRSDTVRRFDSMISTASAPPGLGEKAEGERVHSFQDSPDSVESYLRSPSNASSRGREVAQGSTSGTVLHGRKKRNKCSPEQYQQLEAFFAKNRNPTGKIREELSKRIQMPERSVQGETGIGG